MTKQSDTEKSDAGYKGKDTSIVANYNALINRYPLLVNGTQSACISALGVLASQVLSGVAEFNFSEVAVMMLINFIYNTPILLWFYGNLSKSKESILVKLFIDQVVFSPVFTTGLISLRLLLLGTEMARIPSIVTAVVPTAVASSWFFWLPCRGLIMLYVPVALHLLAGNLLAFVW
eukprot:CAMPEP_0173203970 /NCGR_PEP_ID=MMETSP1141-20130122/19826_1 /TAXON_ID=483371 /ORGANISM="non described non described, Strain CCMP2298" /LENGTH=175 /DNA_ID=CAMNT_0014129509 /DNA_START=6 /DNA_END=530 /DNA_ORIENTATION=-